MISASHNPFGDNGIKLFSLLGTKLPVEVEAEVELELDALLADPDRPPRRPTGHGVGRPHRRPRRRPALRRAPGLDHRRPAARRAAHRGRLRQRRGQRRRPPGADRPRRHGDDAPRRARRGQHQRPVRLDRPGPAGAWPWSSTQADLGLAFDGDADRVIAVDHTGTIVDGDVLLALFALDLAERGRLSANTVAVTVMTNLGFRLAMEARGIEVRETDVGDRHVLAALDAGGLSLGGEQSGHIIFRSLSTTGDGILTGIALADLMRRAAAPWPTSRPAWSSGCPSVWSTCPSRSPSGWPAPPRSGRPSSRPRPSSATRAGSSCARAGPSRSSGSWSRRGRRPRPTPWPPSWPGVVEADLGQIDGPGPRPEDPR